MLEFGIQQKKLSLVIQRDIIMMLNDNTDNEVCMAITEHVAEVGMPPLKKQ